MKACTQCGDTKELGEFHARARATDGKQSRCKSCDSEYQKVRYHSQGRDSYRKHGWPGHLRRKYGLTVEDHLAMTQARESRCDICGNISDLRVDHDHDSGAVRGMLCDDCNLSLGKMRDDPDRLMSAAAYLISYKEALDAGR